MDLATPVAEEEGGGELGARARFRGEGVARVLRADEVDGEATAAAAAACRALRRGAGASADWYMKS